MKKNNITHLGTNIIEQTKAEKEESAAAMQAKSHAAAETAKAVTAEAKKNAAKETAQKTAKKAEYSQR